MQKKNEYILLNCFWLCDYPHTHTHTHRFRSIGQHWSISKLQWKQSQLRSIIIKSWIIFHSWEINNPVVCFSLQPTVSLIKFTLITIFSLLSPTFRIPMSSISLRYHIIYQNGHSFILPFLVFVHHTVDWLCSFWQLTWVYNFCSEGCPKEVVKE